MIKVKGISGRKKIYQNLENLRKKLNLSLHQSLIYGAELLRDKAIENVKNWAQVPGLSIDGESITDPKNWFISRESNDQVKLLCTSKHALVVEFGGTLTGTTTIGPPLGPGFPIGSQQHGGAIIGDDGKPIIRQSVKIQKPMAFFRSARDTPSVKTGIHNRIKTQLSKELEGII
jgi:hypothetical protein